VSENRDYFPSGYFGPEVIASDANFVAPDPTGMAFAIISSSMFIAWQRVVGGRLESRLRFNKLLSWNTFPLHPITQEQRADIEAAGSEVLRARELFPDSSLATLYERHGIPRPLMDAHRELDRVVDKLIGRRARIATESDRLRALFARYKELTEEGWPDPGFSVRSL